MVLDLQTLFSVAAPDDQQNLSWALEMVVHEEYLTR